MSTYVARCTSHPDPLTKHSSYYTTESCVPNLTTSLKLSIITAPNCLGILLLAHRTYSLAISDFNPGEDEWGFLPPLFLVVPLRDFVSYFVYIRRKLRARRQDLRQRFKKTLRDAIEEDTRGTSYFQENIGQVQGVDFNTQLDCIYVPYADTKYSLTNLLPGANLSSVCGVHEVNVSLVAYLLEMGSDPDIQLLALY